MLFISIIFVKSVFYFFYYCFDNDFYGKIIDGALFYRIFVFYSKGTFLLLCELKICYEIYNDIINLY